MKPSIKSKIAKLIDVKSLATLALIIALIIATFMRLEIPDLFQAAVMSVLTYYFARNASEGGKTEA